ncbi:MAG: hypothetical protein ACOYNN_04730 [Terrimicrobiaceae bacterium]
MPDNNPYAEFQSTKLYMDATGKGAKIAEPVATNAVIPQYQKPLAQQSQQVQEEQVDYLANLFDGENLSEDFKLKAATIFEAAINEKVSIIEAQIIEASKEIIEEQTTAQHANLVEHVDGYLNYVISEWMEENKVAIERGLRTEIAENFMSGLKQLFETSFVSVPEDKYNLLDDLYAANAELQESTNNLIKENMSLKNEINARLCAEAFIEESAGLADTQVEKLAKLAEGIEFSNVDQYRQKVALLKESYFNGGVKEEPKQVVQNKAVAAEPQQYASRMMTMLSEDTGSFVASDVDQPAMETLVNSLSALNKGKSKKINENVAADRVRSLLNSGTVQDNFI